MIARCVCAGLAVVALTGSAAAQNASGASGPDAVARPLPGPRILARPVLYVRPPSRVASLGSVGNPSEPSPAAPAMAAPAPTAVEPTPALVPPLDRRHRFAGLIHVFPPSRLAALGPVDVPAEIVAPPVEIVEPQAPAAAIPDAVESPPASSEGPRRRGRHVDMIAAAGGHPEIDRLIAAHAKANNIPESMVHRIVVRESRYNPRAIGRGGAMGLMQIKHATARGLGYAGSPEGLLDADTNLRYAVPYLAGAYRTADGNPDRTVSYYASGYYYAAKAKGASRRAKPSELTPADTDGLTQAQRAAAARPSIFSIFRGTAKSFDPNQIPTRQD